MFLKPTVLLNQKQSNLTSDLNQTDIQLKGKKSINTVDFQFLNLFNNSFHWHQTMFLETFQYCQCYLFLLYIVVSSGN